VKHDFTTKTYAVQSVTALGGGSARAVAEAAKNEIRQAHNYLTDIIETGTGLELGRDWVERAFAGCEPKSTSLPYRGARAQADFGSSAANDDNFQDGSDLSSVFGARTDFLAPSTNSLNQFNNSWEVSGRSQTTSNMLMKNVNYVINNKIHLVCRALLLATIGGWMSPGWALTAEAQLNSVSPASGDIDLRAAIERAVETHPSIAAAKANVRAAGADVQAAKWQRFPSFSVEGLLLNQNSNSVQAQAVVDQPLWAGGRITSTVGRATARASAALSGYDEAALAIAVSTAQTFFDVHRLRERIAILALSLDQHSRMVVTMERRYAQEVSPLSDLELARSRALQIEQQLYQARAQEGAALNRLRQLVGDPFFVIGPLPVRPSIWPGFVDEPTVAKAFDFSPTLKRLRSEAESAAAEARISRASILPQLSGQYSYSDTFGHRVGLVLRAQSDGGLSRFSAANAAAERVQASELQISAGQLQLRDQLFALVREYDAATSRLDGSLAASGSVKRVMESYMRQFTSGRRTWLDVMNAVRETNSAEIDAVEARISAQSALTRLLLLTGQWAPEASERKQ
jgi:adhesin transport system outer membrane protein